MKKEKSKQPEKIKAACAGCGKYIVIVANMGGPQCEKCFTKKQGARK